MLMAAWRGYFKGMVPVSVSLKFLAGPPALTDTSSKDRVSSTTDVLDIGTNRGNCEAFAGSIQTRHKSKLPAALLAGVLLPAALVALHVWDGTVHIGVLSWFGLG